MYKKNLAYCFPIVFLFLGFQSLKSQEISGIVNNKVIIDTLSNGFKYIIQPIEQKVDKNEVRLIVSAGNNHERPDQYEHAHLLEHVAFNYLEGYTNFKNDTDLLSHLKLRRQDLHGFTLNRFTYYQYKYLPDVSIALDTIFDYSYEIASGKVLFNKNQIRAEKNAVYQEYLLKEPEKKFTSRKIYNTLFSCQNPVPNATQYKEWLMNSTNEALQEFYKKWYRPDLMTLIVVGNFENLEELQIKIRKKFENIYLPESSVQPVDCIKEYLKSPSKFITEKNTNDKQSKINLQFYFRQNRKQNSELKEYQREELWNVLTPIIQNRLKNLRNAYNVNYYSNYINYNDLSQNSIHINTSKKEINKNIIEVFSSLSSISRNGVAASEFEKEIRNRINFLKTPPRFPVSFWSDYYMNRIANNEPFEDSDFGLRLSFIKELKLADINKYIQEWNWIPDDISIILPHDIGQVNYAKRDILGMIQQGLNAPSQSTDIVAPKQLISTKAMDSILPSKISSTKKGMYDEDIIELENGLKIILKENKKDDNKLMIHGFSPYGSSCFGQKDYEAILSPLIIKNAGYGKYDKFEIAKFLENKSFKYDLRYYIKPYETGFKGSCTVEDLESFLQMVYLNFAKPRYSPEAFSDWRLEEAKILKVNSKPGYNFLDFIDEQIGHVEVPRGTKRYEEGKKLNYKNALKKYDILFSNPKNYTIVIVGDFKKEKITSLLNKYLGNLSRTSFDHNRNCKNKATYVQKTNNLHYRFKDPLKNTYLSIKFRIPINLSDYKTEVDLELLKAALDIKLKTLRYNKHYGVYSARAMKSIEPVINMGTIGIYLQSSKSDFNDVLESCHLFFEELKLELMSENTMETIKRAAHFKKWKNLTQYDNGSVIENLYDHHRYNIPLPASNTVQSYIREYTAEDLKTAANKYFRLDYRWIVDGRY